MMPQLMPLFWILSVFMIFFVLLIILMLFNNIMTLYFQNIMNANCKIKYSWLW